MFKITQQLHEKVTNFVPFSLRFLDSAVSSFIPSLLTLGTMLSKGLDITCKTELKTHKLAQRKFFTAFCNTLTWFD